MVYFGTQINLIDMKVTLTEVARAAGVSPSTVSRILNGTAKVSPQKQGKVLALIKKLDFKPDPAARALAGGRTSTVGVITQFIDSPFYSEALRGIEDVLSAANYLPIFASGHWDEKTESHCVASLRQRKVDGLIALSSCLPDKVLAAISKETPTIITGRRLSGANLNCVDFDNREASRLAVDHLLELGHRRIAYISGPMNHDDARDRLAGYRAALLGRVAPDPALIAEGDYTEQGGMAAMDRLLDSKVSFTAVCAGNDQMAFGAALALHRRGLHVPEHVSLVGFDDLPVSQYLSPPLTTVRHSARELGARAANAVLALIRGEASETAPLPSKLMVRESTLTAKTH